MSMDGSDTSKFLLSGDDGQAEPNGASSSPAELGCVPQAGTSGSPLQLPTRLSRDMIMPGDDQRKAALSKTWEVKVTLLPSTSITTAFAKGSKEYRRLISRGLISRILLQGSRSDAIRTTLSSRFSSALLGRPWMPLKALQDTATSDICLLALSASELSQSHDFDFLADNCLIKTPKETLKLFIALENGELSWSFIRRLPRVLPRSYREDNSIWEEHDQNQLDGPGSSHPGSHHVASNPKVSPICESSTSTTKPSPKWMPLQASDSLAMEQLKDKNGRYLCPYPNCARSKVPFQQEAAFLEHLEGRHKDMRTRLGRSDDYVAAASADAAREQQDTKISCLPRAPKDVIKINQHPNQCIIRNTSTIADNEASADDRSPDLPPCPIPDIRHQRPPAREIEEGMSSDGWGDSETSVTVPASYDAAWKDTKGKQPPRQVPAGGRYEKDAENTTVSTITKSNIPIRHRTTDQSNGDTGSGHLSAGARFPSSGISNGTGAPHKRRRTSGQSRSNDDDDDGSEERGNEDRNNNGRDSTETGDRKRLACPFYKYDPEKYKATCTGQGWLPIHRLKEHLTRRHALPPNQCRRCWIRFDTEDALTDHAQMAEACPRQTEPLSYDGITPEQMKQIKLRKRPHLSDAASWVEIYKILFPEEDETDIPTPWYDNETIDADHYRRFLSKALPKAHHEELLGSLLQELQRISVLPSETGIFPIDELIAVTQKLQLKLFDAYRTSRNRQEASTHEDRYDIEHGPATSSDHLIPRTLTWLGDGASLPDNCVPGDMGEFNPDTSWPFDLSQFPGNTHE